MKTLGTRGRPDFQVVAKQYKVERQSRSADVLRAVAMTSAAQGVLAIGATRAVHLWRCQSVRAQEPVEAHAALVVVACALQ